MSWCGVFSAQQGVVAVLQRQSVICNTSDNNTSVDPHPASNGKMDYEKSNAADWELPDDTSMDIERSKIPIAHHVSTAPAFISHTNRVPTEVSLQQAGDEAARPGQGSLGKISLEGSNEATHKRHSASPTAGKLPERRGKIVVSSRGPMNTREQQSHSSKWPKIRPENDWSGRQEERMKKEEHRKTASLRRRVEDDRIYGHRGVYLLPPDFLEVQEFARAIDALGKPSRLVKYRQDRGIVEVIADKPEQVQEVLKLIREKLQSISYADNCRLVIVTDSGSVNNIGDCEISMVDATATEASPKAIGLENATKNTGRNEKMPHMSLAATELQGGLKPHRRLVLNLLAMRIATEKTIHRLLHRRGFVEMRLNFGALVYHSYQWPRNMERQPAENFVESLKNTRTEASLYMLHPDAGLHGKISSVLHHFTSWSTTNTDPSQTSPFYVGRFIWHRGSENKPAWVFEAKTEPIRVSESSKPKIDRMSWLPPSYPGSRKDLDIFVTQINGGISSALQITSQPNDGDTIKYPQQLTAQQIQILDLDNYTSAASKGSMVFNALKAGCHDYRQRTVWRFRLKADPKYIFELMRHDGYNIQDSSLRSVETRWSASVYSEDWEWIFAKNGTASPEKGAGWIPTLDTFFPKRGSDLESADGFEGFARWIMRFLQDLNQR